MLQAYMVKGVGFWRGGWRLDSGNIPGPLTDQGLMSRHTRLKDSIKISGSSPLMPSHRCRAKRSPPPEINLGPCPELKDLYGSPLHNSIEVLSGRHLAQESSSWRLGDTFRSRLEGEVFRCSIHAPLRHAPAGAFLASEASGVYGYG